MSRSVLSSYQRRSFNVHSVHGPVINPFESATGQDTSGVDERRVAGGSSGGSAAAVAAGMCDVLALRQHVL